MKKLSYLILFSFLFYTTLTQTINLHEIPLSTLIALRENLIKKISKEKNNDSWKKWARKQEEKSRGKK